MSKHNRIFATPTLTGLTLWMRLAMALNAASIPAAIAVFRSSLGSEAAAMILMVLAGVALITTSVLGFSRWSGRPYQLTAMLTGLLLICCGVVFPLDGAYGPAIPSALVTQGIVILASLGLHHLAVRQGKGWLAQTWSEMTAFMLLVPLTSTMIAAFLAVCGWPWENAIPSGALVTFFINSIVVYWRMIARADWKQRAEST